MEDEATIPTEGTAIDNDTAVERLATLFSTEASETEQAEHVENEPVEASTETETETPEEQYFDFDGEQLSLSDLRNGYLRQSDYTKKSQALAEQRKHYETNQVDVNSLRSEALSGIEALKQQMAREFSLMEVPDFDWLANNDPAEFVRQQNIWQKKQAAVQNLVNAEQAMKTKQAEFEAEQQRNALRDSSERFFTKYPDLNEPGKADAVFSEITQYLLDQKFTQEEIKSIADFRIIDVLYQNILANKTAQSIPEVVAKIEQKPVLKQNNNSAKKGSDYDRSMDNFNSTKSSTDAISALAKMFG